MMKKNNLDEMQEQKLLRIEHNGCWIAYWGLLISIVVQTIMSDGVPRNVTGELCILLALSAYLVIACTKNGIWDRKLKPNLKTNLLISLLVGAASGLVRFIISYRNYHSLSGSIAVFVFVMLNTAVLCIVLLSIFVTLYNKRKKVLESKADSDEAED